MHVRLQFAVAGLAMVLLQSALKVIGMVLTGSFSVAAETVDTLVDVGFSALTIYGTYQRVQPPDLEHMYGHRKVESVATLVQGLILVNLYGILVVTTVRVLLAGPIAITNPGVGLWILATSFGLNVGFSRYLIREGRKRDSPAIEMQGVNLFGDSLRALVVIASFVLALFGITITDPLFSLGLSAWIIYTALKLARNGVRELLDTNPLGEAVVTRLEEGLNGIDHVQELSRLRVRGIGAELYLDVELIVEDHLSMAHAREVQAAVRSVANDSLDQYDVNYLVTLTPRAGEENLAEELFNLTHSIAAAYPKILRVRDFDLFRVDERNILTLTIVVDASLPLADAHAICSDFETELKRVQPDLTRVLSHIEGKSQARPERAREVEPACVDQERKDQVLAHVERVLRETAGVKGYHGFECWAMTARWVIELHVFLAGETNVAHAHEILESLRDAILTDFPGGQQDDVQVRLHPEPVVGRTDGVLFE